MQYFLMTFLIYRPNILSIVGNIILEFITLNVNILNLGILYFSYWIFYEREPIFPMKYNERIRLLREENSCTQQQIADLLHIGQRTYCDYESGKTRSPVDSLLIVAKHYDVSVDYISGASNVLHKFPAK